jgi:predicted acetyltransferase
LSETFRTAHADDVPALARLIKHSFPGPTRTPEWLRARIETPVFGGGPETAWMAEQDGRPVAVCQLHPLAQWIAGVRFACMGLGTVAISPAHRRRGLAGRLVASALRHARERGDTVSALYPFRIRFYERLGYGLAGEALQYRFAPELLPDAPERAGIRLVETESQRAEVRALYEAWVRAQSGQVERTDAMWRDGFWEVDDTAVVLYRAPDGRAEGYARARYRTDLPPAERFLEIEERVWLSRAAQRAIYAWIASLGDQWQSVLYRAHPAEGFENYLRETRMSLGSAPQWGLWFGAATLMRGPMFRLLDVPAAWAARPVNDTGTPLVLRLEVSDREIPENDGPWRMRIADGRVEVEPWRGEGSAADATLALPVSTLSRLFVGDLAPSMAVAAGHASIDHDAALPSLDAVLRLPKPWTFERF